MPGIKIKRSPTLNLITRSWVHLCATINVCSVVRAVGLQRRIHSVWEILDGGFGQPVGGGGRSYTAEAMCRKVAENRIALIWCWTLTSSSPRCLHLLGCWDCRNSTTACMAWTTEMYFVTCSSGASPTSGWGHSPWLAAGHLLLSSCGHSSLRRASLSVCPNFIFLREPVISWIRVYPQGLSLTQSPLSGPYLQIQPHSET